MALVSCLAWLSVGPAASGAELSWQGSAGCPDREELVYRIERALGGPLARSAPLHFRVRVAPSRYGVDAQLDVTDGVTREAKERVVSAPDCEKLADAVALTIALALGEAKPDAPQSEPPPPAIPDVPVSDEGAQAAAAEHQAGPTPGVSLWLLGDTGSLPSAGLGAAFGLELSWQRIQLRALASLLFEQHAEAAATLEAGSGVAGADLGLALGSISVCASPYGSFRSSQAIALCAGWEVGRMSGTGTGVPQPYSGGALWLAPRVELGGLWALPGTQLRLGAFVAAAAPLSRSEFVLEELGRVHRASTVVGRAALGAVWVLE